MRRPLLIVVAILIIGTLSFVFFFFRNPRAGRNGNGNARPPSNAGVRNTAGEPAPPEQTSRAEIVTVSRMFSERYGSLTSDDPSANLVSALPYASRSLQGSFKRLITARPAPLESSRSTTSRAYAFSVPSLDEKAGTAEVIVTMRRTERVGNAPPQTYTQDLKLSLLREDGSWRVNLALWGGR